MDILNRFKDWWNNQSAVDIAVEKTKNDIIQKLGAQICNPKSEADDTFGDFSWERFIDSKMERNASDNKRYMDYEVMDEEVPEMSSALDVNADFVVYPSDTSKTEIFKVKTKLGARVQKKINDIASRTNIQEEAFTQFRNSMKYGDNFEEIIFNKERTMVLGFRHMATGSIVPNVVNGILQSPAYLQLNSSGKIVAELNENEVYHLSLALDRQRYVRYRKGISILQFARLSYRQLRLMEEGLMITRLSRANQNYALVVDTGNLEGDEALDFIDKYKKRLFRRKYINQQTGQWSWEYNPLSVIEDIVIPTRQGSGANVISLNNANMAGKNIEDISYFQDKMLFATHTPKILIGKETDVNSKSTTETQMVGFLRKIRRFQGIYEPQIKKFFIIALAVEGIAVKPEDLFMEWPISNYIDEERKWRIEKLKLDCAAMWAEMGLADDLFIYTKLLGMTEDEAEELIKRLDSTEQKYQDEIDDMFVAAADESDMDGKDFEKSVGKDEEDDEPTKDEVLQVMRNKLGEEKFNEWMKIQRRIEKYPEIKQTLSELIELTQAKLFQ